MQAYANLLIEDKDLECARSGIKTAIATWRGDDAKYAGARTLAELGRYDDAEEAIKSVLTDKETAGTQVPEDLQTLSGAGWPLWQSVRRFARSWGWLVGGILVLLLLLLVVGPLKIVPWLGGFIHLQLDVGEFSWVRQDYHPVQA